MRCNISKHQAIFCGRANYKQYYEAKTSSIFRLVELNNSMAPSLMVEAPVARRLAQGLQTNKVARAIKVTPFRRYTTRLWPLLSCLLPL